jgi:hypothetical protein
MSTHGLRVCAVLSSCEAMRPEATKSLRPNPRLQRTRSAPLRSPLSRKPLCVGKFRAASMARQHAARPAALAIAPPLPGKGRISTVAYAPASRTSWRGQVSVVMKLPPHNMALQRTRRPRFRSDRSLRSLGSPLNAQPLDAEVNDDDR